MQLTATRRFAFRKKLEPILDRTILGSVRLGGIYGLLRDRTTLCRSKVLFSSHIVSTDVAHCRVGHVGDDSVSSQTVNGTNRGQGCANSVRDFELLDDLKKLVEHRTDPAALLRRDFELLNDLKRSVEQKEKTGRLLRRNSELLDDLSRLAEQTKNTAPEKPLAAPLRNSNFEEIGRAHV